MLAHIISIAALAFSFSYVSATRLDGIPECAVHCYGQHVGNCEMTDVACRCRDTEVITVTSKCIIDSCAADELESVKHATQAICAAEGASLIVPARSQLLNTSTSSSAASAATASQTSPAQPNEDAAAQNANGASSRNINIVVGVVAFGLVVLAI